MSEIMKVDRWEPSYSRGCEVCGLKPVVTGVRNGRTIYSGSLCGVHTWGRADADDPTTWNAEDREAGGQ
jgi:hypothetical protein